MVRAPSPGRRAPASRITERLETFDFAQYKRGDADTIYRLDGVSLYRITLSHEFLVQANGVVSKHSTFALQIHFLPAVLPVSVIFPFATSQILPSGTVAT
jgi:hypothetical protein